MKKTLEQIIAEMGERWLLHPANHIRRRATPFADSAGVDVARTFARVNRERAEATLLLEQRAAELTAHGQNLAQFTPRRRQA